MKAADADDRPNGRTRHELTPLATRRSGGTIGGHTAVDAPAPDVGASVNQRGHVLPSDYWSWQGQDTPWYTKLRQADRHIAHLRREVEQFRDATPYTLKPEATDIPGRYAYRLRYTRPIPVDFSAIVGDVLNNLRAALENVAYEIARRGQDGSLRPDQESVPQFPICATPDEFADFFSSAKRKALYSEQAQAALRIVQPFANAEMALEAGDELWRSYEEEAIYSQLYRLHKLWNIDKHRRLTIMVWWLKIAYWTSNGETSRRYTPTGNKPEDGAILFHMDGEDEGFGTDVHHQFNLVLADDPAFIDSPMADDDVIDLLSGWHQHIAGYVIPRVFTSIPVGQ